MFGEKWPISSNEKEMKKPLDEISSELPNLDGDDHEEQMDSIVSNEEKKAREDAFFATRHGVSGYKLNTNIVRSRNPEVAPDADKQWFYSDLTPEGKEAALAAAEKFFDNLDPQKDALFFVSSDLVRAAETAKIYLDVAKERGFEIILPRERSEKNQAYENKAEEIGEGRIRKINCLTLDHLSNTLREFVFTGDDYLTNEVSHPNLKVSVETREKWRQARDIIEADNKGSWGPNYAAHSEEIAKIFPDVKSAKEIYETKFKQMLRLVRFGQTKIEQQNHPKNIKVLAFSHENSFLYFLNQNFNKSMKNCESIGFEVLPEGEEEGKREISVSAKGKKVIIASDNSIKQ